MIRPRDPGDLAVRALGVAALAMFLGAPWGGHVFGTALAVAADLARDLVRFLTLPGRALDPGVAVDVRADGIFTIYRAAHIAMIAAVAASGLALALAPRRRFPWAAAIAATAGAGTAAAGSVESWGARVWAWDSATVAGTALHWLALLGVGCVPLAAGAIGLAVARRQPRAARAVLAGVVVVAFAAAVGPDGGWPLPWGPRGVTAALGLALALELGRGLPAAAGIPVGPASGPPGGRDARPTDHPDHPGGGPA